MAAGTGRTGWLRELVIRKPLVLPALFFGYLASFVALVAGMAVGMRWFAGGLEAARSPWVRELLAGVAIGGLVLAFGHYFRLVVAAAVENLALHRSLPSAGRALQVLVSIILVAAVGFYYLQLLSRDTAFAGMHPILSEAQKQAGMRSLELLFVTPPVESVVDCLYFSVVTASTVGYGDIHPAAWWAKVAVILELVASFTVIVLALGGPREP